MTIDILALARKHLDQTNARCNTLDFIEDDADIIALYRHAYAAGMEAAAVIADDMLGCETDAVADAIRAANGREGKQ